MLEKNSLKIYKYFKSRPILQAFSLGALSFLAFAPFNFFIFLIISLVFFYKLLEQTKPLKDNFILGFSYGYGYFLFGIYWIAISLLVDATHYAWLIPFALTIIPMFLALYIGFLALMWRYLLNKFLLKETFAKITLFAILWVFCEAIRSTLFSGFAWNLVGYSWLFSNTISQVASLFGIYFLSFTAVLCSLSLVILFARPISFKNKIFLVIVLVVIISKIIFGYFYKKNSVNTSQPQGLIRIVQPNIKQEMKWQDQERYNNFIEHLRLSSQEKLDDIDAVIWSETSIPFAVEKDSPFLEMLKIATPKNGVLISGAIRVERNADDQVRDVFNSIFMFDKNGILDFYDKHHLVPFGEYVPLHKFLSFLFIDEVIDKITQGGKGFTSGVSAKTLTNNKFTFNPLICYEVIFSNEIINNQQNPDLFVNLTNDAWFKTSSGPYQHLAMSQMRSIEYGKPMIRVAGTGISALIDQHGSIVKKIALNQRGVVDVRWNKNNHKTFYHQYGNRFLIILLSLLMIFLAKNYLKKLFKLGE